MTEFQDEFLQQVIDVGPFLAGIGLFRGWAICTVEITHTATGTEFETVHPYDFLATQGFPGFNRTKQHVWVMACQLRSFTTGDSTTDEAMGGYTIPSLSPTFSRRTLGVARCVEFGGQLEAGTSLLGLHSTGSDYVFQQNVPMMLPDLPESLLRHASSVTFDVSNVITAADFLLWVGKRGQVPPVRVGQ